VELDRQTIERRDFPIARRGYDPAAVDAHLQALAREVEELVQGGAAAGAEASLATAASSQVQSILQAAETAAADIERDARQLAQELREAAERDARETREQAIEQARSHVGAVSRATSVLLERVGALDSEAAALLESLRAGANRLAGDLATVDANMGELYDAASGRAPARARGASGSVGAGRTEGGEAEAPVAAAPPAAAGPDPAAGAPEASQRPPRAPAPTQQAPAGAPQPPAAEPQPPAAEPQLPAAASEPQEGEDGDIDGARLVALNMALNGETREATERYLAEHFRLSERRRLVEEVYAAIEA
jgi:DivIVA domain-containing protein